MSMSRILTLVATLTLAVTACGDPGSTPPPDASDTASPVDTLDPADTADPVDTADPADTAEPVDTTAVDTAEPIDTTPPAGLVTLALETADGEQSADALTVYPDDELSAYQGGGAPGFQANVVVHTANITAGELVELQVAGAPVAAAPVVAGERNSGEARFEAVTLPSGSAVVSVSVTDQRGETLTAEIETTYVDTPCTVEIAMTEPSPCFSVDADPDSAGFQAAITLTRTGGDCASVSLSAIFDATQWTSEEHAFGDGDRIDTTVTLAGTERGLQGTATITAVAKHAHSAALDTFSSMERTLDTLAPAPYFVRPDPAELRITAAQDVDLDPTNGVQYDIRVAGGADDVSAVALSIDGEPVDGGASDAGVWTWASHGFTSDGVATLTATATDACGNGGVASAGVDVYVTQPVIDLVGPADGAVLLAREDADPMTALAFDLDFDVRVTRVKAGTELSIACRADATALPVKVATHPFTTDVTDAEIALPATLDTTVLGTTPICAARVSGYNPATSAVHGYVIALPAPTLELTSPTKGDHLNRRDIALRATTSGLDGRPLRVLIGDEAGHLYFDDEVGVVTDGAWQATVSGTDAPFADGGYIIVVDATDAYGNLVSDTSPLTMRQVELDATAPAIVRVSPARDTVDPVADPTLVDADPLTPGYQTTLTWRMDGETVAEGATICPTVDGDALPCKAPSESDFTASWTITLIPGVSTVSAIATDAWGNASAPSTADLTLHLDAPAVTITSPAAGLVTASTSVAVVVHVADPDNDAPIEGATVTLLVDGAATSAIPAPLGGGDYRFGTVALSPGAVTSLQAVAAYSGEEGASAVRDIRQKDTTPEITIVTPADGTVFNLASAACVGTQADCVTDIEVAPSELEPGQAIDVVVTCDGITYTTNTPAPEVGNVVFSDITLPQGASCTISAHASDAAGQPADAAPVVVAVDRIAPRILAIVQPAGSTLTHIEDQKPGIPGMQAELALDISGVEADQEIFAAMAWTDADGNAQSRTVSHIVTTTTSDADTYRAAFTEAAIGSGLVQYPEGPVTLRFTVADAAGNGANALRSITVETDAPAAHITSPAWLGDGACSDTVACASGVCYQEQCWRGWGVADSKVVVLDVAGLITTTDNVRVCSDARGVSTSAVGCASPGFHQVALASAANGVVVVDLSALPEEPQHLIAEVRAQDGGAWTSSLSSDTASARERRVFVDLTPPTVLSVASPSDTEAPTGTLNAAEQASDGRGYTIAVQADEDGPVSFYANGQLAGTATVTGGQASMEITLKEGANSVYARVTDRVGNVSSGATDPALVTYAPTVDTVAPTLAFTAPAASPIIAGRSRDVAVSSDAEGATVTVRDADIEVATADVSGGAVSFPHDGYGLLSDGTHTLTATVSDAAGNTTTVATSPTTVVVDTVAPSLTLEGPQDLATFTADDDPQPATPAIETAVAFVPSDGAASWTIKTATCDDAWACGAATTAASGGITTLDQLLTRTVALAPYDAISHYEIEVTVADAVGNQASATTHVTLVVQDCVVTVGGLGGGDYVGQASCGEGGGCPLTITATASGLNCVAVDGVTLIERDGAVDTELGTSTSLNAGVASFTINVSDGDHIDIVAQAKVGDVVVAESALAARTVDLVAPSVTATPVVAGTPPSATVFNASNDDSALAGYQVSVAISANDDHLAGGAIDRIVRAVGTTETELAPTNVTLPHALATQFASQPAEHVTLTDLADNTVTVYVKDAAGNVGTASFTATVDGVAPAAVALATIDPDEVDRHRPSVTLRWLAVGEDNGAGDAAAAYDVRYSRLPITDDETFAAACQVSAIAHSDPIPTPGARGTSESLVVGGPDARDVADGCKLALSNDVSAWYFAVRAQDDAGNWGPVTAISQAATTALQWQVSHVRFTAAFETATGLSATAAKFLGAAGANIGDVNGDGADDFATGFFMSNAFCVIYGGSLGADVNIDTASGNDHGCVIGTGSIVADATAKELGSFIDPLGDVNGDGYADFGVSGKTGGVDGFVAIYLGSPTGPDLTAPELVVRGIDGLTAAYGGFCGAGNFDGGTAPATDDIAVGEPGSDRLRVIPGSTAWTPGQATTIIDLDSADVETTYGIQSFVADFGEVAWFGNRCQRAGELLPTPSGGRVADDLLVHQAQNEDARVFVIPGRPLTPGATGVFTKLDGPLSDEDVTSVRLRQDPTAVGTFISGYGSSFFGGTDVTGDGVPDVVIAHTGRSTSAGQDGKALFVYDGQAIAMAQGADLRVDSAGAAAVGQAWPGANGAVMSADVSSEFRSVADLGNYDGWFLDGGATPDLAIADKGFTSVQLRFDQEVAGGDAYLGLFPYSEGNVINPAASGMFSAGLWVDAAGDADGDGALDVIVGTANNELLLIH